MGNSLHRDIKPGTVVVLREDTMRKGYKEIKFRLFKAQGGFGMQDHTIGRKVYGRMLCDNEECYWSGYQIDRIATEEDMKAL